MNRIPAIVAGAVLLLLPAVGLAQSPASGGAAVFTSPSAAATGAETDASREVELAEGLAMPEAGHPNRRGRARPPGARRRRAPREAQEAWDGPRVELGYTHYVLADGWGGGDVNAGVFGGYLPTGVLRLGASAELGGRVYALAQDDALLRATVIVGYQHLPMRPFVPYAGLVGTLGLIIGNRYHTPVTHILGGAGLEVGVDVNLVRTLYIGLGLGYQRVSMEGVGHDLWVLRLRIGL